MKNLSYFCFGVGESHSVSTLINYDNDDHSNYDNSSKVNNKGDNNKDDNRSFI